MPEPQYGQILSKLDNLFNTQVAKRNEVQTLMRSNQVLGRWITQDEQGAGEDWSCPVIYKTPRGIGVTRAQAQMSARGEAGRTKAEKWKGEWAPIKASLIIDEFTLELASKGDDATRSFLADQQTQIKQLMEAMGERFEESLWVPAGLAIAVGSINAGVITLTNKLLTASFRPGDVLEASADDGSSTGHSTFGTLGYVIKAGDNAGTITVSATDGGVAGSPAGWTGTIYLFRQGMFGGGTSPEESIISLPRWLPATDPSGTFLNVDRTKDPVAFSGVRVASGDISTTNHLDIIEKALVKYQHLSYRQGGKLGLFVHPEVWNGLKTAMENRVTRTLSDTKEHLATGLTTIGIVSPMGEIPIFSAPKCSYNQAYLLDKNSLRFRSVGKYPHAAGTLGSKVQVGASEDNYEWRLMGYGQLQMPAPGANMVIYLPGSPSMF